MSIMYTDLTILNLLPYLFPQTVLMNFSKVNYKYMIS